jgi:hypothetical protein
MPLQEDWFEFLQFDPGSRQRGEIVEITLSSGANVRLMTSSDFSTYKNTDPPDVNKYIRKTPGRRVQQVGG